MNRAMDINSGFGITTEPHRTQLIESRDRNAGWNLNAELVGDLDGRQKKGFTIIRRALVTTLSVMMLNGCTQSRWTHGKSDPSLLIEKRYTIGKVSEIRTYRLSESKKQELIERIKFCSPGSFFGHKEKFKDGKVMECSYVATFE